MTNVNPKPHSAQKSFAPGSSRGPRSVRTFLDQMARAEDARTSERGDRIRELRAGIPQPRIADQVGVTLRAYQEWEAGGGIGWDNLVKLAEVFGVTEEYIEFGVAGRPRPGTDLHRSSARSTRCYSRRNGPHPFLRPLLSPGAGPDQTPAVGGLQQRAARDVSHTTGPNAPVT
jgi:transcriptional regulator with XRE-family HTH domain